MSQGSLTSARRLAELRESFDDSFSRPAQQAAEPGEKLLRLRVGGVPVAVRLAQLAGLHLLPRVVPLPGAPAGLLGLVGLRGQLLAVHDLAVHLGLPAHEPPRWLLLAARERRVGLAASAFEGQIQASPELIRPLQGAARPCLGSSLAAPGAAPLPIVDVELLVEELLASASAARNGR